MFVFLFVYYIIRPLLLLLQCWTTLLLLLFCLSCYIVLGRNSIDSVVDAVAVVFVLHFHFVVYFSIHFSMCVCVFGLCAVFILFFFIFSAYECTGFLLLLALAQMIHGNVMCNVEWVNVRARARSSGRANETGLFKKRDYMKMNNCVKKICFRFGFRCLCLRSAAVVLR